MVLRCRGVKSLVNFLIDFTKTIYRFFLFIFLVFFFFFIPLECDPFPVWYGITSFLSFSFYPFFDFLELLPVVLSVVFFVLVLVP